jgi:hypothetical protein
MGALKLISEKVSESMESKVDPNVFTVYHKIFKIALKSGISQPFSPYIDCFFKLALFSLFYLVKYTPITKTHIYYLSKLIRMTD